MIIIPWLLGLNIFMIRRGDIVKISPLVSLFKLEKEKFKQTLSFYLSVSLSLYIYTYIYTHFSVNVSVFAF